MQLQPRYSLLERLGVGATSTVYRAEDAAGSACVLKVARDVAFGPTLAVEGFHAHLAGSPRLPDLLGMGRLRVDDSGAVAEAHPDGLPAIALLCRPGVALASTNRHALDIPKVALGVADALDDLHRLGLAHGDLKPENVLIDGNDIQLLDLGAVGSSSSLEVNGATPRYLALGDSALGDARQRDLLAFGLLLAELLSPEVRAARAPLAVARRIEEEHPLAAIARALLSREPSARPSASWVARQLSQNVLTARSSISDGTRKVRGAYLRLRLMELGASRASPKAATWLAPALEVVSIARTLCRSLDLPPSPRLPVASDEVLGPLDAERRVRWLAGLTRTDPAPWQSVVAGQEERAIESALVRLADSHGPEAFTLPLLAGALRGIDSPMPKKRVESLLADPLNLARELARIPVSADVLAALETDPARLPSRVLFDAAEALRLQGETARARRLLDFGGRDSAAMVELLRRTGEPEEARSVATRVIDAGSDDAPRARAILARIELDRGNLPQASEHLSSPVCAPEFEVAALVAHREGNFKEAERLASEGRVLALNDEQQARLAATLAYVIHPSDPSRTHALFADAAKHALRAGAVLEEATYLTGQAASALDLGLIEEAERAASRAILLFEDVIQAPSRGARAWLVRASIWATLGVAEETEHAVERVLTLSSEDPRARRFALLLRCDAAAIGDERALAAAREAIALSPRDIAGLLDTEACLKLLDDDDLRCLVRLLRHSPDAALPTSKLDLEVARREALVQHEWWHARAERLLLAGDAHTPDAALVLDSLDKLRGRVQPGVAFGRAMYAGRSLAEARGDATLAESFETVRRRVADQLLFHVAPERLDGARLIEWIASPPANGGVPLDAIRADTLASLVRSLSERDDLDALLNRVLDVLIEWASAERGLLLLRRRSGELSVRAARGVSRRELKTEQREVSTTLAERALTDRVPIVAVDAMTELGDVHESVAALALRSVLVVPLVARGDALGVVYLDDRRRIGAFREKEVAWANSVAPLAALAIADARRQLALKRANQLADRARESLERELSRKEHTLEAVEAELTRASFDRRSSRRHPEIIGASPAIERLLALCDRVSRSEVPVLVEGESGTGKELVARAIHQSSARAERPFIGVNCGALPETLLESTLFGHERGAFTGATRAHVGLFEAASGGTLFLDEVGEMSLGMQSKLLRVLEVGRVRPVGAERDRRVDVRVVAATHRDLSAMVGEGRFRDDLLYRLDVIRVRVPPLRERREDIPLLVTHFVSKYSPTRRVKVEAPTIDKLTAFDWPGNVRQLENEIRRALVLSDGTITSSHLRLDTPSTPRLTGDLTLRPRIDALEAAAIREALERTGGNKTKAAALLGLSRYGLLKLMTRLSLRT